MANKDYYEILGVKQSDDKETIKKSYKKLALKYHPDIAPEDKKEDYEHKFKEISEAYSILGDDKKRSQYDSVGNNPFGQQGYSQGNPFQGGDFSSMFDDVFGNGFFGGGRSSARRQNVGRDLQYRLNIKFEEAAFGIDKEIEIKKDVICETCNGSGAKDGNVVKCGRCNGQGKVNIEQRTPFGVFRQTSTCPDCNGKGKIPKEPCQKCNGRGIVNKKVKMSIEIPAGIDDEQVLRVSQSGNEVPNGISGDLLLIIGVKPHKIFQREGDNIYMNYDISFSQAALGCNIKIPTLKGETKIKIPAATQSEAILRLKGKGIRNVSHYMTGDQFITIKVKTPKSLSKKEKQLFKELENLD